MLIQIIHYFMDKINNCYEKQLSQGFRNDMDR